MKKGFVFLAGFLMAGSAANAQISDASEMMRVAFDLLDVNNDGVISSNEYKAFVGGIDADVLLDDAQKRHKKSRRNAAFKTFDKNGDGNLEKDEFLLLMQTESMLSASERQNKVMEFANNPDKAEAALQDSLKKFNEAVKKLENMSPDEMANNFLKGISSNIADENYFQMDKNKDGCVTESEYAAYMVEDSRRMVSDPLYALNEDESRALYRDEKKAKPNCLTKDEYLRNYDEMLSSAMGGDAG